MAWRSLPEQNVHMDVFATKLRERAAQLGISNAEVARRAGLSERRYGHYVSGVREPDLRTLLTIAATANLMFLSDHDALLVLVIMIYATGVMLVFSSAVRSIQPCGLRNSSAVFCGEPSLYSFFNSSTRDCALRSSLSRMARASESRAF